MNKNGTLVVVFLAMINFGYSQMAPAKMLPPNVESQIKIKAPVDAVYNYLKAFDNFDEYAKTLVSKSKITLMGKNPQREIILKNGSKRLEELVVIAPNSGKLGIKVLNPDDKFSRYFYYFEIESSGSYKSKVVLKAYYGLNDNTLGKEVKKDVLSEFKLVLQGLKSYFEN